MDSNNNVEENNVNRRLTSVVAGALLLIVSIGASQILAGAKLGFLTSIPGCGVGSGCDAVTGGPWGVVPWLGWPVSFVGVAWFVSLFIVWVCGGSQRRSFVWIVRFGVLGSIGFLIVMLCIGHFCKWCALAHACNLLFWVLVEITRGKSNTDRVDGCCAQSIFVMFSVVFIGVSVLLGAVRYVVSSYQEKQRLVAHEENIDAVLGGGDSTLGLLDAIHVIGPKDAPVQVVIFTDYQCPDCKRIEGELVSIVEKRDDVSVAVKHFPLCFECNGNIGSFNLHPNACWAARAAEAASIVGGEEGWEKMHKWLFSRGGQFTDNTFSGDIAALGFNPREFVPIMMDEETLRRVNENADDGFALGIYFTPMVFVNGVEYLWYYGGSGGLSSLIDAVAKNVVDGSGGTAPPPSASEKLIEDWRRGRVLNPTGRDGLAWTGDGDVEFIVWGDYQASLTQTLDGEIKKLLEENDSNVTYAFRYFPIDQTCNAVAASFPTTYDGSCYLSKLVESVYILAGNKQRWLMHDWVIQQPTPVSLGVATSQAASLAGVDESVVNDVVGGIDVNKRMRVDILSKNNVWRKSIPVLTIDGRFVPRWKSKDVSAQDVFHRIIDVVGKEGAVGTSR